MNIQSIVRRVVLISLLVISDGCVTTHPGTGSIYVSQPQVFTRERLINRRLEEQAWLEKQLKVDSGFSLQGSIDNRQFVGLAAAVKGSFDPLGSAQSQLGLEDVKRNSRIGDLQDELQAAMLQKQIESVQNLTSTNVQPPSPNIATNPAPLTTGSNLLASVSAVINMNAFSTSSLPPLPNPTAHAVTTSSLTSVQTLDDQLAKRNYIQALLREQELDDTHDLSGMTVYTLKFDLSVIPGLNNPSFGQVSITLQSSTNLPTEKQFRGAWSRSLQEELRDECMSLQRRRYMNFLSDEEKAELSQRIMAFETKRGTGYAAANTALYSALTQCPDILAKSTTNMDAAGTVLAYIVRDKYEEALKEMVTLEVASNPISIEGTNFFVVSATTTSYEKFTNALGGAYSSVPPYAIVVEPKEYSQNVSDMAARQRVLSLAASLSAMIPQAGASVGFDSSYVKNSQQIFDTIKRQPLVVGFSGDGKFGWVLGPKFAISSSGKLAWSHTPIQHSVQASVVVPGWWKCLALDAQRYWLKPDGTIKATRAPNSSTISVRLPGNYAAITRLLLAQTDNSPNRPSIQPRWDSDILHHRIAVRETKDETILIRGQSLWRNPKVFIGAQAAEEVQVLPDMNGLLASFKNIRMPPSAVPGPQRTDLSVVTSGGIGVLRDGVEILPQQARPVAGFASLLSSYVVNGKELSFEIDAKSLPKSYGQLALLITDPNTGGSTVNRLTNNFPTPGVWKLIVNSNAIGENIRGNPQEILVDLKIGQTPNAGETLASVLQQSPRKIVYFPDATNTQFQFAPASLSFSTNAATETNIAFRIQTPPNLLGQAFPGLTEALVADQAKLSLTNATKTIPDIALKGIIDGPIVARLGSSLFAPTGPQLPWTVLITYVSGQTTTTMLCSTNLTITWGK